MDHVVLPCCQDGNEGFTPHDIEFAQDVQNLPWIRTQEAQKQLGNQKKKNRFPQKKTFF